MSENEDLPKFELKTIPLGGAKAVKFKMDSMKPIEGESQYGTWHMWFAYLEGETVVWGKKGETPRTEENYSGKVIFFAPNKMNENLLKTVDGNQGVEISVTKQAEETEKGTIIKRYIIEKLSDGEEPSSSSPDSPYTTTESQIIEDCKELISGGTDVDKITFMEVCKEKEINPVKAQELYRVLQTELKK